jgi:hypothetical protein
MKHIKEYGEFNLNESINENLVGDIWERFKALIKRLFVGTPAPTPAPKAKAPKAPTVPPQIEGQHMLYLPHQQGPSGAAKLVKIAKGKEKLDASLRSKLLNNMPSSDPNYNKVKTSIDKDAVLAFLDYQKNTWVNYEKDALSKIKAPENLNVKKAIEKVTNKQFPINFLTTVAYKESRFNPNPPTNKSYRGLFQIGDLAWKQLKRINPSRYKGAKPPLNTTLNAQAGHDYLKWSYDQFEKLV